MTPEQTAAYVDAAATALDLSLAPEHRPGVLHYFALAASMADVVNALPLAHADEAAPQFAPIAPGSR